MSDLSQSAIEQRLSTVSICREAIFLPTIDSTNSYGMRLLKRKPRGGVLIVADYQSGGRGRQKRRWLAPEEKALLFSFALVLPGDYAGLQFLTLLGAVSVAEALRDFPALEALIKWPNDVVVGGKKICGVLTELVPLQQNQRGAVMGIGLNVNQQQHDFPPELREKITSVRIATGKEISRLDLLASILARIDAYYAKFLRHERHRILQRMLELSSTVGRAVRIRTQQGLLEGTAVAIEEDGALAVRRDPGTIVKLYSGDVEEIEWAT
jgi:BirA family biotin operon repressor/biotin-[acetyl-CoA-carboxylase] ligase